MTSSYSAPFPWFGGKSRVAGLVWQRFGDVPNYVEPFFGSGAVLLARPHPPQVETINDKDCMVANFWRALQNAPDEVAKWADWPVNEADLHARHLWLVSQDVFRDRMMTDPHYYDPKIAGWWVWGQCVWIGRGWCKAGLPVGGRPHRTRPHLGNLGRGMHRAGLHSEPGRLLSYMRMLADRLRRVRVCCGDWSRVCTPAVTTCHGLTGIFLDPPYSSEAGRDGAIYACEDLSVARAARDWAVANGENPLLRIALCGYEGEYEMPKSWECVHWQTAGGYGLRLEGRGRANRNRERIWFSPHCMRQQSLFEPPEALNEDHSAPREKGESGYATLQRSEA